MPVTADTQVLCPAAVPIHPHLSTQYCFVFTESSHAIKNTLTTTKWTSTAQRRRKRLHHQILEQDMKITFDL